MLHDQSYQMLSTLDDYDTLTTIAATQLPVTQISPLRTVEVKSNPC